MNLRPVAAHLLDILLRRIEVGYFIGPEHIVDVLGKFGLEWRHHSELLTGKYLYEKINRACEHHRLLLEVFDVRPLSQKLRHVTDLMPGLF